MSPVVRRITPGGIAYRVVGSGPPMLWLSGYVVSSTALDPYVAAFSDNYSCVVFDARGSGRTPTAIRWPTTTSMAYDALDVLRDAGYDSAHVHGLSLGGMVAQEIAIRAPHKVRTLVLGATTAGGTAATPARLSTMWSSLTGPHSPVPGAESVNWTGALQQALAASTHDAGARLGRIQSRTLVMHGARDRLLPAENAEVLARLIPGAALRVIPRAGHFYPVRSTEASSAIAREWLADQGDVAPPRLSDAHELGRLIQDFVAWPVRRTRAQLMPFRHAYRLLRPQ